MARPRSQPRRLVGVAARTPPRAIAVVALLILNACGGSDEPAGGSSLTITVFAAASLSAPMEELAALFESERDVDVLCHFAGSPTLLAQLRHGAGADVFAPAGEREMTQAIEAGLVNSEASHTLATNRLVVVVSHRSAHDIERVENLGAPGVRVVMAGPAVPAGRYTREALDAMRADDSVDPGIADAILANVVSFEDNVKAVLMKVRLGEADAGFVYATDVAPEAAGEVSSVEIPDRWTPVATCPIAPLAASDHRELAAAFVALATSEAGRAIMARHRFGPPASDGER